jgi:hypothetical protein
MPITFSAVPLPDGLALDAAVGVISGVPATAGTTQVRITAGNSAGSTSACLVITVAMTPPKVPMEAWRSTYFGASAHLDVAADAADPDGDGADNLLEYTRGTDPLSADPQPARAASPR